MRKTALCLILPVLALLLSACSDGRKVETPVACHATPERWLTALAEAPDQVLLENVTPISACLPADQSAAKQEEVGLTALEVANNLSGTIKASGGVAAGKNPNADRAALMAGYLVGAIEKGAGETDGIHDTLVTRIEAAATNGLDQAGQAIQGEFQVGYEAGRRDG